MDGDAAVTLLTRTLALGALSWGSQSDALKLPCCEEARLRGKATSTGVQISSPGLLVTPARHQTCL